MYYPRADIDFIKDKLDVVLLKKFKKLSVRAKKMRKEVCVIRIIPRLSENQEWWLKTLDVNERIETENLPAAKGPWTHQGCCIKKKNYYQSI